MKRKTAASALSALLFAQGLLGVGALAATLLDYSAAPQAVVVAAGGAQAGPVLR